MTMMNGLETYDLDIMDEEYYGPPPRFLVEGNGSAYDSEAGAADHERLSIFPGITQIRKLVGAW